jgi:cytoskeletal protein CcmA (bactofilin family)
MFNSNTTKKPMAKSNEVDSSINIIRSGTSITGDINCTGDIRIDGKLVGNLKADGKVVIGEEGVVEGTIECGFATIAGGVKVDIRVNELLILKSTANLVGEIITNKLQIEPGANFSGNCKMGAVIKGIENAGKERSESKKAQQSA